MKCEVMILNVHEILMFEPHPVTVAGYALPRAALMYCQTLLIRTQHQARVQ